MSWQYSLPFRNFLPFQHVRQPRFESVLDLFALWEDRSVFIRSGSVLTNNGPWREFATLPFADFAAIQTLTTCVQFDDLTHLPDSPALIEFAHPDFEFT
jgi:hypothetical protein